MRRRAQESWLLAPSPNTSRQRRRQAGAVCAPFPSRERAAAQTDASLAATQVLPSAIFAKTQALHSAESADLSSNGCGQALSQMRPSAMQAGLIAALQRGAQDLDEDERCALMEADELVLRVALRTAASVARTLRAEDVAARPVAARKAERDVLELAARELQLLVLHTAAVPHALDGRLPLCIETGRGLIGIEVCPACAMT